MYKNNNENNVIIAMQNQNDKNGSPVNEAPLIDSYTRFEINYYLAGDVSMIVEVLQNDNTVIDSRSVTSNTSNTIIDLIISPALRFDQTYKLRVTIPSLTISYDGTIISSSYSYSNVSTTIRGFKVNSSKAITMYLSFSDWSRDNIIPSGVNINIDDTV
ncbi:hypothetical protein FJ364_00965 [Candidatus Dependentiae bacterium]|nr:hypothetical protein [Candidatus Dependentiae bacterium]